MALTENQSLTSLQTMYFFAIPVRLLANGIGHTLGEVHHYQT